MEKETGKHMKKYPEVYKHSLAEAENRSETDLFRESHKLNTACRRAVEAAVREGYDYEKMHLKSECAGMLLDEYGADRVMWVLADTVQQRNHDGRFSRNNKEWADSFNIPESITPAGYDLRREFAAGSHPGLLDCLVNMVRREAAARENPPRVPEKPSLMEELKNAAKEAAMRPAPEKPKMQDREVG